mgnify:CR=1 FL=1
MAKKKQSAEPLTGAALLAKVKTLNTLSKTQKAKACGYTTVTKGGVERVNLLPFLNALLEAEGIELDSKVDGNGRGGRTTTYRVQVHANGNLLIGAAYTAQMGIKPGDAFAIKLRRKHIQLQQLDSVH